jgi:uncharacterized ubiquitin-like protein YukD
MTGAIFSLKVKGQQDTMLTSNPQHNFITREYKRHVDFASEKTRIYFYESVNFGKTITVQLPKNGDFLGKLYFCFSLPPLVPTNGTYACWTNSIGHAIIDHIDLEIGNKLVDRQYGLFMEIWEELTGKNQYLNPLIGKTDSIDALQSNALAETFYQVPLRFFFCENLWSALPLLCMQYHQVKLVIKLKNFSECVSYDGTTQPSPVSINDNYLLAQYIYLDETERLRYKSERREILISQTQYTDTTGDETNSSGGVFKMDIPFNHPVKELLWVFIENDSISNNDWFNFSKRNNVPLTKVYSLMKNCKLIVEGKEYCEQMDELVFRCSNTQQHHTNTTDRHIYCIPFCEYPESWEPNGSLNFSRVDNAFITGDMRTPLVASRVYLFGINHNWMIFENGLSAIKYIA